jgi:hypothetical protein
MRHLNLALTRGGLDLAAEGVVDRLGGVDLLVEGAHLHEWLLGPRLVERTADRALQTRQAVRALERREDCLGQKSSAQTG